MSEQTARATQGQSAREQLIARLRHKKPLTAVYRCALDPDVLAAHEAAVQVLAGARGDTAVKRAEKDLAAAKAALEECTVELHFEALPRDVFDRLLLTHEPAEDDRRKGAQYDTKTFPPALIAACSTDGLTEADALGIYNGTDETGAPNGWNGAESAAVFFTALGVNQRQSLT